MLSRSSAPILEEEVFASHNFGPDCSTIGDLLYDYGEYAIAAGNYLQMLESLTRHFIAEEHWNLFDDFYSPDYTVSSIWENFIPYIRSGALAGENLKELEAGLMEIEASEAYQEYHIPSMIPFSDLKNSKTFL